MEKMMKMMVMKKQQQQPFMSTHQTVTKSPLSNIHKDSHTISKVKPKIRIIHIFAPEIIKTDVANFRELVQRLTGKPSASDHQKGCKKNKIKRARKQLDNQPRSGSSNIINMPTKKVEMVKEEEVVMWNNGGNSGGFFAGFADFDGFIQELGEFPLLPLAMESNHHLHGFGETTTHQFA